MRHFLLKSTWLIIIPTIVSSLLMLLVKDNYGKYANEKNVLLAYNRMSNLEDTTKMVIIAGSNGSFGIDSKMLKDSFQIPVVNTCSHAGIGVKMQFEIYKDLLNPGDIVIFCPEYYDGKSRLYGESTLLRILSNYFPAMYMKFSFEHWLHSFKYIGIHFSEAYKHRNTQEFDGVYSIKSVNEFGDIACKRFHTPMRCHYNFVGKIDDETINYYKYIHSFAKENKIKLIYLPPTLNIVNYQDQKKQIDSIAECMSNNGIPYKTKATVFVFPDSLYIDTPYHLTLEGAKLRTRKMIPIIKQTIIGDK